MAGKNVPKSYRIPPEQVEFIHKLVALKILGKDETAVVRTLLGNAIKELTDHKFIENYLDSLERLKKL